MVERGDELERLAENDRLMRQLVLQTTIREVIHPFAVLYLMLIGDRPLHVGEFEIIIRRRPLVSDDYVSPYDLSDPRHPAYRVATEAALRRRKPG